MDQTVQTIQVNEELAKRTLDDIDKAINWTQSALEKIEKAFVRLSRLLWIAKQNAYWTVRGYTGEEEYIHATFPQSRAQYYQLIKIGKDLQEYPQTLLESIGRSKCYELARIKQYCGGTIPHDIMYCAQNEDQNTFRRRVRNFIAGQSSSAIHDPHEEDSFMTFRFFGDQIMVVNRALDIMGKMTASEKNIADRVVLICGNFLSQMDSEDFGPVMGENYFILMTIRGLIQQLNFDEADLGARLVSVVSTGIRENYATPSKAKETETESRGLSSPTAQGT